MDSLIQWGLAVVQWVQTFRNPIFDQFFLTLNVLGDEQFYILFLPILYWCLHKSLGIRLSFLFLVAMYLNQCLKDFFAAPRPYQVDSQLYAPIKQPGYGIPSAHAQSTTTVWGYIATQLRRPFWWGLAIAIPVLVSIGRLYLGDHFPQDVLAGAVLGIVGLAAYILLEPRITAWLKQQTLGIKLALAFIIPVIFAVLHLTDDTGTIIGTLLGFYVGLVLEEEWIRFNAHTVWWNQVLKFLVGMAIILGLRFGLKAIFPVAAIFDLLRYTIIGVWIGLGAPWLFVTVQWAKREPSPTTAPTALNEAHSLP